MYSTLFYFGSSDFFFGRWHETVHAGKLTSGMRTFVGDTSSWPARPPMNKLLLLSLMAGLLLLASRAQAQERPSLDLRPTPTSAAALFLESSSHPPPRAAAQTCTTARGCVVLGTVLTVAGLGVTGLGVAFLTQLDTEEDDLVTVPVIFLGGTLVVTGLISTGVGIHLISRGRRLRRMNLGVGWQGAPAARLRVRF